MKTRHKTPQFATPGSFQPDPLTPEQLSAIDLLIQGKSDQEVADIVGRDRGTVWRWKSRVPFFMATLEARRQEVFGVAVQRLRNLLGQAIDNIAKAVESGDVKSSFELVKATGLHGFCPPTGETNVRILAEQICLEVLAREHIPEKEDFLLNIGKNPGYEERKREILEELGQTDLIS
jgi:DNA-binding CsgD family transcriptional regulator/predicted sugar kinase